MRVDEVLEEGRWHDRNVQSLKQDGEEGNWARGSDGHDKREAKKVERKMEWK